MHFGDGDFSLSGIVCVCGGGIVPWQYSFALLSDGLADCFVLIACLCSDICVPLRPPFNSRPFPLIFILQKVKVCVLIGALAFLHKLIAADI